MTHSHAILVKLPGDYVDYKLIALEHNCIIRCSFTGTLE